MRYLGDDAALRFPTRRNPARAVSEDHAARRQQVGAAVRKMRLHELEFGKRLAELPTLV